MEEGRGQPLANMKVKDLDMGQQPIVTNQNGLLVLVSGEVVGLDMVSRAAAFRMFHPKLIRSYVMDALTEKPAKVKESSQKKRTRF